VDWALVWNGSGWGNVIQLDNTGGQQFEGFLPTTPNLSVTLSDRTSSGQVVGSILTIRGPPTVVSLGGGL
jgi:hypothetical protein